MPFPQRVNSASQTKTMSPGIVIVLAPFLEVKPNTQYVIGLVPSYGSATTPWYSLSTIGCFYDKNQNYINYFDTNPFTTPSNAKYIRFNMYLSSISLDIINERAMMVEGTSIPSDYVAYLADSKTSKVEPIIENIANLNDVSMGCIFRYKPTNNEVMIYDKQKHIGKTYVYDLKHKGGNGLFDFFGFYKQSIEKTESGLLDDLTTLHATSSD